MLEYLILNNRLEAAAVYHQTSPHTYREELLAHFTRGKRSEFLRLFLLLRKEEKLQFYLRVYFLVYSIHPSLKNKSAIPDQELNAFKQYLDTHGADLAKTNEFLEFYALPFIKKPLEHASFKSLFKKEWVNNLTEKLHIFLQDEERRMRQEVRNLTGPKPEQEEQKIKSSTDTVLQPSLQLKLKLTQDKNAKLLEQLQQLRAKYSSLQGSNQALVDSFNTHLMESQAKWFQITRELTSNARTLIELILRANCGLTHDRKFQRVKKRTEKFQKVVKRELEQVMNQEDLSVFDKPSMNEISCSVSATPTISQKNITTYLSLQQFVPTNYPLLLRDFKKMDDEKRLQILEGFSWRIIKSRNKWVRRQTIVGLVVNDFLGLMSGDVQSLIFNKATMYHVLKLLLYISEDTYGNKVLFRNGGLYKEIVELLPQVHHDKNYACLAVLLQILQNIWHNREILLELIHLNIVDICVNTLLEDTSVVNNEDILESIVTLLLNATSLEEGLDAYQEQINIFFTLSEAFKVTNDSNRNLIGAIIYALVGRKTMWKYAHDAKLPNFIDDLIVMDARSNKQQLKLIQAKLQIFQQGKTINLADYSQEEIDSNLQEQIFERNEEEITYLQGYIKGHEILSSRYGLKNKEAEKQIQEIDKIMQQFVTQNNINSNQNKQIQYSLSKVVPNENKNNRIGKAERHTQKEGSKDSSKHLSKPNSKEGSKDELAAVSKEAKDNIGVKLPEIKNNKERVHTSKERRSNDKFKTPEDQEYYSYKSPNFKHLEEKEVHSMQVQPNLYDKKPINSFEIRKEPFNEAQIRVRDRTVAEQNKKKVDRASAGKQQYRIKKSSSVQKNIGSSVKRQQQNYISNRNPINLPEFKVQGVKSPTAPKRTRQQVLRQLNQQLKQQRKLSGKNITDNSAPQRENAIIKKNTPPTVQDPDGEAFAAKPKLKRTPPKQDY